MYILALVLMMSCMGLEAFNRSKVVTHAYNATNDPVIIYSRWSTSPFTEKRFAPDSTIVQSRTLAELKRPTYGSFTMNKGSIPLSEEEGNRSLRDLAQDIPKDPVIIIEEDPVHKSGLKARVVSGEAFEKRLAELEKEYKKVSASGAPGGPAFPVQEEVKASVALNPEELAG